MRFRQFTLFPEKSHLHTTSITPSLKALLIQLSALLAVTVALICLKNSVGVIFSLPVAAAMLGIVAAVMSMLYRMDWWWVAIGLCFAPALVGASALALPPVAFLIVFLLLLGIFWSTFKTQVPLFLSGPAVWDAVESILPGHPLRYVDIGSGLGGVALALAERRPDSKFSGVEIAPLPWLISVFRARLRGNNARFFRLDYRLLDFADYDVIFAYLSPAAMPALWQQATAQMGAGSMLISFEFGLADVPPDFVCHPAGSDTTLFVWHPFTHRTTLLARTPIDDY